MPLVPAAASTGAMIPRRNGSAAAVRSPSIPAKTDVSRSSWSARALMERSIRLPRSVRSCGLSSLRFDSTLGSVRVFMLQWRRVVIVTDSEYVFEGATLFIPEPSEDKKSPLLESRRSNADLWEALSEKMGEYAQFGCEISFWHVRLSWISEAAAKAVMAVTLHGSSVGEWRDVLGAGV
ncbi:hypothetical protein F4780DRAFT_116100 [Xylariomycetidae sp. FL0641]|nr:hypothetical protein F4780DRAFT_116100 [Xylariomycetidae sp. FL0641]